MKKLIIAFFALTLTSAYAADILVLDSALSVMSSSRDTVVDAKFQVNTQTGEGSVLVDVTEYQWSNLPGWCDQWGRCYPQHTRLPVSIFREQVKVEGLSLQGEQLVYAGAEGDVNCGRLGKGPVFGRPTIYLSGNCKLNGYVTGNWNNARVNVIMTTK